VLLGETLMVPIADSMVYIRPLYVSSSSNAQPVLQDVVAVLGKNVYIDTSLQNVLQDLLNQQISLPTSSGVPSTGTLPAAVTGDLAQAQTDYNNALAALKAQQLGQFQSDLQLMEQELTAAQDLLTPAGTSSSTTTTTSPGAKGSKSKSKSASTTTSTSSTSGTSSSKGSTSTTSSVPSSTEPSGSSTTTTSTTLVSAAPASG
jgi:hypothetical protein